MKLLNFGKQMSIKIYFIMLIFVILYYEKTVIRHFVAGNIIDIMLPLFVLSFHSAVSPAAIHIQPLRGY